jgi:hypothetical protein
VTTIAPEKAPTKVERHTQHVRHIRRPDNPDVAWCGAKRRGRMYYWHEVSEADMCVVCLSYPGALEYARGDMP